MVIPYDSIIYSNNLSIPKANYKFKFTFMKKHQKFSKKFVQTIDISDAFVIE